MQMRFIGQYTNDHTSITPFPGLTFEGHEPREVPDDCPLVTHPEFEVVDPLDHDGDGKKGGSPKAPRATRTRGKAKK